MRTLQTFLERKDRGREDCPTVIKIYHRDTERQTLPQWHWDDKNQQTQNTDFPKQIHEFVDWTYQRRDVVNLWKERIFKN